MHLGGNRRFVPLYCASSFSSSICWCYQVYYWLKKCSTLNVSILFESYVWQEFVCLQIKKCLMSLSHWMSFIGLLRRVLTPLHQFSFNICYSAGKGCLQGPNYWSKEYHKITRTITSRKITNWDVTCRSITTAVKLLVTSKRGASSLTLVTSLSGKVIKRKKV